MNPAEALTEQIARHGCMGHGIARVSPDAAAPNLRRDTSREHITFAPSIWAFQ